MAGNIAANPSGSAFWSLERERKSWAAGLRTHMMVCVGSVLIMIVSSYGFADVLSTSNITLDPSRVAAQVVSGIGFLGAGSIFFSKEGSMIRGLTTAAGLWTVAAIGLSAGAGMYNAATITTIVALIILWALKPVEQRYIKHNRQKVLKVIISNEASLSSIFQLIQEEVVVISFSDFSLESVEGHYVLQLKIAEKDVDKVTEVITWLEKKFEVREVFWNY